MNIVLRLLPLLLFAACSSMPAARTPPVVHLPPSQVATTITSLPAGTHVSTGQPDDAALRAIRDAGYVAVIDLRTAGEDRGYDEMATATDLGLRYVSLPVGGPADVTYANAATLDRALDDLDGPALLHCASGNRVGALFALRASAAGASDEEALAIGRKAGLTQLEDTVRKRLAERH